MLENYTHRQVYRGTCARAHRCILDFSSYDACEKIWIRNV